MVQLPLEFLETMTLYNVPGIHRDNKGRYIENLPKVEIYKDESDEEWEVTLQEGKVIDAKLPKGVKLSIIAK